MDRTNCLLLTDSRGTQLESLLNLKSCGSNTTIDWTVKSFPGATLETIAGRAENFHANFDLIIVIAGICNLTTRIRTSSKYKIEYRTRKADEVKLLIQNLLEKFGEKIHICTITPADLNKQHSTDVSISDQQSNLLEDIENINQFIIDSNICRDLPTIDLASNSYVKSLKKQGQKRKKIVKFSSKDLPDGVHPSLKLKEKWSKHLLAQTPKIFSKIQPIRQDHADSETESSLTEDESWDFRRNRVQIHAEGPCPGIERGQVTANRRRVVESL